MRSFISHFRVRQLRTDFLGLSDSTGKTLPSSVPKFPVFPIGSRILPGVKAERGLRISLACLPTFSVLPKSEKDDQADSPFMRVRTAAHGNHAPWWREGGAMGTSRPTATGHGNGAGRGDTSGAHGNGTRQWGAGKVVWHGGAHHAGVMAVGRDVPIAPPE